MSTYKSVLISLVCTLALVITAFQMEYSGSHTASLLLIPTITFSLIFILFLKTIFKK